MSLQDLISRYEDSPEAHRAMWDHCLAQVQATPYLKEHRDFVEAGGYGYGDRPFHWVWHCLARELPPGFKFLEIGVFQGQTLSLMQLAARECGKQAHIYGITPLSSEGDKYATHPDIDYVARMAELHRRFNLKSPTLLCGQSFDPRIQARAEEMGPFDLIYVDGCHDYEVALDDLESYGLLVRPGGYLVLDDAGNDLELPADLLPGGFKGLEDVNRALWNSRVVDHYFDQQFAVGHLRVFRRV